MTRRLVLGDIHGKYDYLMEVLQKCNFDYENDLLIQIGDVVDRGPDPFLCIEELLKIKNRVFICGNHDSAFISKITRGDSYLGNHTQNGQGITIQAWNKLYKIEKNKALEFFQEQVNYHVTEDNIIFVHGGFVKDLLLENTHPDTLQWDRELWTEAMTCEKGIKIETLYKAKDIFIGHTPTIYYNETLPMVKGGITNIDTGCGKSGPLTIMDIDTKEYWQSEHNFLKET